MTISPRPMSGDMPPGRKRYEWDRMVLGEFQVWLDVRDDANITDDEALKQATRIRLAARAHANTHGLKLESRRSCKGRLLCLRFTLLRTPSAA